jgi:4-amino-4-deoxy-L-arabinose transferase-like glycosyltransferase
VGGGRWSAIGLAILAGALVAIRLNEPGWFDNEGRFAEVAREMVATGDWVTPRVNGFPLLTKPPLTQWLAAIVFSIAGSTEWARLVAVFAAMATVVLTCRLGARLYGVRTGLVGGLMLVTMAGFVFEARTLRPDCLVVLTVTGAIHCWHVAEFGAATRRTRWLVVMYVALGMGILAKGLVPPVLAAIPIGVATTGRHGIDGVRRLRPLLGLAVMAAVVLPWHVAAALANPGFAWDYVVNQHLLFALDRKEPRDSEGDTLGFFWQAFAGRALPWVAFVPFTLAEAVAEVRRTAGGGTALLWAWIAGTLGLFSLTPSRLEHYALPALPAVALLAARALACARTQGVGSGLRLWVITLGLAMAGGGVFGLVRGRALAEHAYWLPQAPGLVALVVPAALAACWAGLVLVVAGVARRADGIVAAGVLGAAPFLAIFVCALIAAESLFSWRPVARAMERLPVETEVVFQAPVEYQIVGGLDFYLGRTVTMLEPPGGYTPPTYLEGRMQGLFISHEELERRWQSGRAVALVSDPQQRRDAPDGLVPMPYHVFDRFGDRWVLTNVPVAPAH